jgi:hypothetical protein
LAFRGFLFSFVILKKKFYSNAGCQWLMLAIRTIEEAEIIRNMFQGQARQIVCETPSLKI